MEELQLISFSPNSEQNKIIKSKLISKIIWGVAFSGKTSTICWRAQFLINKGITPLILCFTQYHKRLLLHLFKNETLNVFLKIQTFEEWMLDNIQPKIDLPQYGFLKLFKRDETLTWLAKHNNQWTGNSDPEKDLEVIWAEKLYPSKPEEAEYQQLMQAYTEYLQMNQAIDEIDLFYLFAHKTKTNAFKNIKHILLDEVHEASLLDLQIINGLAKYITTEIFFDYDQSIMSWRTPLGPIPITNLKKILSIEKNYYLTKNYITSKEILKRSRYLIKHNSSRSKRRAIGNSTIRGTLKFNYTRTKIEEGERIQKEIQTKIQDPAFDEKKIGILCRNHQQTYEIAEFINKIIPTHYFSNALLRTPEAQIILAFLRICCDVAHDYDYELVMNEIAIDALKHNYKTFMLSFKDLQIYFCFLLKNFTPLPKNNPQEYYLIERIYQHEEQEEFFYIFNRDNKKDSRKYGFSIKTDELDNKKLIADSNTQAIFEKIKNDCSLCFYQGLYTENLKYIRSLNIVLTQHIIEKDSQFLKDTLYIERVVNYIIEQQNLLLSLKNEIERLATEWKQNYQNSLLAFKNFYHYFPQYKLHQSITSLEYIFQSNYLVHLSNHDNIRNFLNRSRYTKTASIHLKDKITICTIHEGRHQVFDMVILPRVHQNIYPDYRTNSLSQLEEERRLFNVAILRCREHLVLTAYEEGQQTISPFLKESKFF